MATGIRTLREYMGIPMPDARTGTSYGSIEGGPSSDLRVSRGEFPYWPDEDDTGWDRDSLGVDVRVTGQRRPTHSPGRSIPDASSFIDGASRIHELSGGPPSASGSGIFTTGPRRQIGSVRGWSRSPVPMPDDEDPVMTLRDIADQESQYLDRWHTGARLKRSRGARQDKLSR